MCGICGLAFSDGGRRAGQEALRRMADALRHRGPDSGGFFDAPGIALAFRRLSIIDLETGDQPISNEDGTLTLVCNGEIYNAPELCRELVAAGHRFRTRTDVEVILHLYEDHGPDCVRYLRGMFGFALWDSPRRRLMLARDRLGIKPLQYALSPAGICFGSELKSILAAGHVERRLDVQALKDLFSLGFVVGPKTMLSSVRRLQPGEYLLFANGSASIRRYWDVRFPPRSEPNRHSADHWAEALREKLRECVRIHLRSDVPVGAWLSSGIDSSAVVAIMCGLMQHPPRTVSIAFEHRELDELRGRRTLNEFPGYMLANSRVVCGSAHLGLLPKAILHCEDISATGIEIPRMLLSQAASGEGKVAVSGEGSDEVFGGYGWYRAEKLLRPLGRLPLSVRRLMLTGEWLPKRWPGAARMLLVPLQMNLNRYMSMMGPLGTEILDQMFSEDLRPLLGNVRVPDWELSLPQDFTSWHPFNQLQYYEMKTRLPDFINHHVDRTSMAHSLEIRVPFLDHEFVEFCSSIPASLKLHGLTEKFILRKAMEPLLPREICLRPKRGMRAPFKQWMRESLPDFAAELLSSDSLRAKGYFNARTVRQMLVDHRAGSDYGQLLIGILAVQLWDEIFVRPHAAEWSKV